MLDKILPYEKGLFFSINGMHNDFFDHTMWLFSSTKMWIPLGVFLIFNFVYKKNWRQWLITLLAIVLLFTLCDQFSSHLIKPLAARLRPTHYPGIMEHVRTLYNYSGGRYGFISGHATNTFGFVVLSSLIFKYRTYTIVAVVWACIMSYTRVYLGVHFISDIVAGAISGILIGIIVYNLYLYALNKIQQKSEIQFYTEYSVKQIKVLSVVIACYMFLLSALSDYLILLFR
jgi:undecaprenyl-diphosphatase